MVCPCRLILVGLSVVVAAWGVLFLNSDVNSRSEPEKSWARRVWEYANGSYLIERWKNFWDKGGIVLCQRFVRLQRRVQCEKRSPYL